jgi:hypothetical protein
MIYPVELAVWGVKELMAEVKHWLPAKDQMMKEK